MADTAQTSQIITALAGVGGVLVGSIISWVVQAGLLRKRIEADEKLATKKFEFDKDLAERKFTYDRDLHDHKRRVELTEEVLAGFLGLPTLVRSIRSPISYSSEAKDRVKPPGEPEDVGRQRDTFFVILARFESSRKEVAALLAKRTRMEAMFGRTAGEPFQRTHEALNQIVVSASMLMDWAGRDMRNPELIRKMESDIWFGMADPDPIAVKIDEAVAEIEAICGPIIRRAA